MTDPILLDVPSEMKTERLMLRTPRFGDGSIINPAVIETIFDLAQWMPWAEPTPSVEDTEKWCRSAASKYLARDQFHYLIFLKSTGDYIGTAGIHRHDWKVPWFEIGYWLRKSQWGNGYTTEAVNALTNMSFNTLGAQRVEIRCDDLNPRSARVAELAGYSLEGVMRKKSRNHRDQLCDTRLYAKVKP